MDSLKEKNKPAPNPSKRPRIEVDEELMRQMSAGQAPLDSNVVRRIPEPKEENTDAPQENISDTAPGVSVSTAEKTDVDPQNKFHKGAFRIPAKKNFTARSRTDLFRASGLP